MTDAVDVETLNNKFIELYDLNSELTTQLDRTIAETAWSLDQCAIINLLRRSDRIPKPATESARIRPGPVSIQPDDRLNFGSNPGQPAAG